MVEQSMEFLETTQSAFVQPSQKVGELKLQHFSETIRKTIIFNQAKQEREKLKEIKKAH